MKRSASTRRRPVVHITLPRAARLYRLVTMLTEGLTAREKLLDSLAIGLRTFYRELDLLKRCGIKVRRDGKAYQLTSTVAEAEARLPFPDPQLSFAEMAELSRLAGEAARRLSEIYQGVIQPPPPPSKRRKRKKSEG
jgi:predicted DNA-binding transcriptional regulator YafY